jgi:hypothetical protein
MIMRTRQKIRAKEGASDRHVGHMISTTSALLGLLIIMGTSVWPSMASGFDLNRCLDTGHGTIYGIAGAESWRMNHQGSDASELCMKALKEENREKLQRARDDVEREERLRERAQEAEFEVQARSRQRKLQQMRDQLKCDGSGTCASGPEVEKEIQRLKREAETRKALGSKIDAPHRFVLLEEVKEPASKRQPEISFGIQLDSADRYVRIVAVGLIAPPEIQIVCDEEVRKISLSFTSSENERIVATYQPSRATVLRALTSTRCNLMLAGEHLSIPQDKLVAVWGDASSRVK